MFGHRHKHDDVRPSAQPVPPLTVYFVRHAQPINLNMDREADPHLTALGITQAHRTAGVLASQHFDHIYASTLVRARMTAEPIAAIHPGVPFTLTDNLREVHVVHLLPGTVVMSDALRALRETQRDDMERFVNDLRHKHAPGQHVLAVCHGNIIQCLMAVLGNRDPATAMLVEINHASISIMCVWESGYTVLKRANCCCHLPADEVTR